MDKLRQLRKKRVLTLQELADLAGITYNSVWRLEHGKHGARPATLRKLAEALNVPVEELVEEEVAG